MAIYSEAHICQCLSRLATARRDSVVTIYGDRRKTGMQFVEGVICLARGLIRLGIKPGDVVSISALNSDLYLEWMLAITYVGGIVAPLNYRWSLDEAKSAMEVAQPVLLVTDSNSGFWHSKFSIDSVPSLRWHVVTDIPAQANNSGTSMLLFEKIHMNIDRVLHKGTIYYRACLRISVFVAELLKKKPTGRAVDLDYLWAPQGAAIICFTSGTTGKPKGAAISHSALIVQSMAKISIVRYDEDDVYLHTAPLCHIGGISSAMAMLMAGGCHVILPKFEAKLACEAIREHLVTSIITVPTMMADLISINRMNKTFEKFDSVRKILNGGGGLSIELIKDAIKLFPRATLLSAYGMTEACSSLTFMTLYDPTNENPWQLEQGIETSKISNQGGVCVGKPAPHIEIRVRSDESADTGRILMRGPHAMLHYWGQSPANSTNPAQEVWLDTGDLGQIDCRGNLWLNGRAKDRIKTGGENVYPEEVEGVISKHPGISRIVVVGVPNSRLSEMVIGCVQLKDGWKWTDFSSKHSPEDKDHSLSSESIRQFCKAQNLTGFKIPRRFILWNNEFTLTTTGKLRRDRIRAEVVSQMEFLPSKL